MAGCIVGWAHTPFGKLPEADVEALVARVATQAVADAGITPADIGAVYLGVMNNGFSRQDFAAGMIAQRKAVRFRSAVQVNDYLPLSRRSMTAFEGAAAAWRNALAEGGVSLADLSFVETHDCFTIAELIERVRDSAAAVVS